MRPAVLGLTLLVALAGAAGAQTPPAPSAPGPFVGDETHREHVEGDVAFPEGVTPPERPAYSPAPRARGEHRRATARRRGRGAVHVGRRGRSKASRRAGRRRR